MAAYSEWEMVQLLNNRDQGFFPVLHGMFFRILFVYSRKMGVDPWDAEEIVNDVFVRIYTVNRGKIFESWTDARKYLYKAVRNNTVSHLRRVRVVEKRTVIALDNTADGDHLLDMLELKFREAVWASNSAKLRGIFETTPYRFLDILRMLYFEGRTVPEIAVQMGITEQTVRNLKTKGLDKMAKILRKEDFLLQSLLLILFLLSVV